uniref:Reverse transcriptase domain-containing protein n=1 Tax=Cajanus cajan TaxID=3821 RepID=A0A151RSG3_CAJCA|nr:hypothetical protein KK1_032990 [Cajanus cajan]
MVNSDRIKDLCHILNFDHWYAVDRSGRGGGLALLWKDTFNITITQANPNYINVNVKDRNNIYWRLTGFYGYPERRKRKDSWDLLRHLTISLKRFWEVCGKDILFSCNSWLEAGVLPPHINDAVIALIPKCPNPSNMKELRPIALCKVIYKILSKALANRLKPLLQNWMMMCITSVHFQILLNGIRVGSIIPGRGLRQGDPLSPYLFILGMEGLSSLIHKAKLLSNLQGIQINRGAPKLNHLMFADDVFLFFQATEKETKEVASILETFEIASGQPINFKKSEVFLNRHAPLAIQNMLSNILHVQSCETTGKYLGLPSMIGRNKNDVFRYIKERIWKKLQS